MAHDEHPHPSAETQENKPILLDRMILVRTQQGALVEKYCLGFLERHALLSAVFRRFPRIPLEPQSVHACRSVPTK
jgi:hypothetical protein